MAKTTPDNLHQTPDDIQAILDTKPQIKALWEKLTPLSRNEWICWVTIVKTDQTRKEHLERLQTELLEGKRRPCCWPGCPHRNPKAQKWFK